jgi:hypothetical protein
LLARTAPHPFTVSSVRKGLSMKTGAGVNRVLMSPFLFAARVERRR